ncbi:copper amine oxidase N-terminal domain-containing protein [Sedimentibacter sp. zth1]|uniref:copper amine oxidase N-terminal domain-containing protein n=1 Tax=Sedimentibacter sp. zth1 TaxID=2816908 RepID=UPI001A91F19B|nr:copper amine oxidase N-terminal domain-containing protein [Sedimentibacter sp. zth1]
MTDGETIVSVVSNNDIALINGVEKKMDVCATVLNGRILVPVRFISEAFNNVVIWDGENSTVIIH